LERNAGGDHQGRHHRRRRERGRARQQIVVSGIKEKGKELALPKFGGGVTPKEIAVFTRQFSVMVDAGLPLVQCIEILGGQQPNPAFQKALLQIRSDVEGGASLSDAMRKHPKIFDDLYCNLVKAGEAGGILETTSTATSSRRARRAVSWIPFSGVSPPISRKRSS
jgi:type IV pilus assembly protein PilC